MIKGSGVRSPQETKKSVMRNLPGKRRVLFRGKVPVERVGSITISVRGMVFINLLRPGLIRTVALSGIERDPDHES